MLTPYQAYMTFGIRIGEGRLQEDEAARLLADISHCQWSQLASSEQASWRKQARTMLKRVSYRVAIYDVQQPDGKYIWYQV